MSEQAAKPKIFACIDMRCSSSLHTLFLSILAHKDRKSKLPFPSSRPKARENNAVAIFPLDDSQKMYAVLRMDKDPFIATQCRSFY